MGGFRGQKFKNGGNLPNGWTDWHQIWHTYADSSENEHRLKNNYPLNPFETPGDILRGLCGKKIKPGKCGQAAGLIGTNFGALMQIHLERVVGRGDLG